MCIFAELFVEESCWAMNLNFLPAKRNVPQANSKVRILKPRSYYIKDTHVHARER